ncbi:hypothetical protein FY034_18825 (plasmid) [Trichlorobacter lovleyi]|uniref:hypothetical protein n=1 Tax=Trichlorobacter lovleyi TaxID=313985 RepID=UPI00223FBD63|nr:hypothetical protein [Trichlorobacter lovleyi]QOX81032.1 hypothetical protein FY034_18825 [Trichlorobacter lovleyi]
MRKLLSKNGYEVWAQRDGTAGVIELFTDPEGVGYVGCADNDQEALAVAESWIAEQVAL